jgi:hypothetical protein
VLCRRHAEFISASVFVFVICRLQRPDPDKLCLQGDRQVCRHAASKAYQYFVVKQIDGKRKKPRLFLPGLLSFYVLF